MLSSGTCIEAAARHFSRCLPFFFLIVLFYKASALTPVASQWRRMLIRNEETPSKKIPFIGIPSFTTVKKRPACKAARARSQQCVPVTSHSQKMHPPGRLYCFFRYSCRLRHVFQAFLQDSQRTRIDRRLPVLRLVLSSAKAHKLFPFYPCFMSKLLAVGLPWQ